MTKASRNKFILGFMAGVLVTLVFGELSNHLFEKGDIINTQVQISSPVLTRNGARHSVEGVQLEKKGSFSEKKTKGNSHISSKKSGSTVLKQELPKFQSSKSKVLKIIEDMGENDLKVVYQMLESYGNLLPSESFDSEPIDEEWALQKQAELEYTFYSESPLRDKGELDSIQCRSEYCRVTVKIPKDIKLKPSDTRDWGNPVSISQIRETDDPSLSVIELYIPRINPEKIYQH